MSSILNAVMGADMAARCKAAAEAKEAAAVAAFWTMRKGDLTAWQAVSRVKPLPQSKRLTAEMAAYWNE